MATQNSNSKYNPTSYSELISSYQHLKASQIAIMCDLLATASKSIADLNSENKTNSSQFNPLYYFNIYETTNSRILADLFDIHSAHGQDDLFLSEYLKSINMLYHSGENWHVACESDKVDIILSATNPTRVVVIENKINGAVDQANQLYRYYQLKIEPYLRSDNIGNFKVVYLTKHSEKKMTDGSIYSKDKKHRVPEELLINQTFQTDIRQVLETCLKQLHTGNYRLRAFIQFFIEQTTTS